MSISGYLWPPLFASGEYGVHGVGCKAHPGTAKGIRALPHVVWQGGDFCASKISTGVPALPGATESPIDPRRGRIGAGCVTPSYPVFPPPCPEAGCFCHRKAAAAARIGEVPAACVAHFTASGRIAHATEMCRFPPIEMSSPF